MSQVSILEPLRAEKRALALPVARRQKARTEGTVEVPNPWRALEPLGDKATRSATSLGELAVLTQHLPDLWPVQNELAKAIGNELIAATDESWRNGIRHGRWIAEEELGKKRRDITKLESVQSQLMDLTLRFQVLEGKYEEAKAALQRSSLRDISNQMAD